MNVKIFHSLLESVAMLFLLSIIYELNIVRNLKRFKSLNYYIQGVMIGFIGVIIMSFPFIMESGVIFDTRSILIGSAALTFSIPTVLVASTILIIYRIFLGGIGMWAGILMIISVMIVGIYWKKYILPNKQWPRWVNLLFFGITIHIVMILCFFAMPWPVAINAVRQLGVIILTLYPASTLLLCSLLFLQKDRDEDRAKLLFTEEKYRNLFNNYHTIMLIIDPSNGNIIDANPAAVQFYGWTHEQMLRMNMMEINNLSQSEILSRMKMAKDNQSNRFELNHKKADGSIIAVEIFSGPIQIDGQPYLYSIIADVSEKKRLAEAAMVMEQKIHQQQRLESIGTLAGGVAHEINNPINGIMNFAQLIKEDSVEESDNYLYSDMIIRESDRISNIVRNLLQFSRYEKVIHSYSDISDIIHKTLSLVNVAFKKDQITILLNMADDIPKIRCRSQQIQQVFMNLLTNARDALNDKYPEYDENKKIEVNVDSMLIEDKDWIVLRVKDYGNGIHPSVIGRIYEPFFSTKPKDKGTGLGLSISFGIVKDHHGKLEVESDPGEYTCFYVKLPVDPQEVEYE